MAKAKSPLKPFRVFFGAEDFLLDRELYRAKRWTGRDVTCLDGNGLHDHELVDILDTPSTDRPRAVIVDDAQKVKGDKALKAYIEDKSETDTSVVLAAFIRADKLPELWLQAANKGKIVERPKLKTWDNNNEVVAWIEAEAALQGIKLAKGLSKIIYDYVGADLYRLASELQKLAIFIGPDGEATSANLALTISPSLTAEPWQVAEAAVSREQSKAMNLLSTLYKNQGDDANLPMVSALIKQIEKIIPARQMLDRGMTADEIATIIEMHPYRCKNFFVPMVRKHHLGTLIGHMTRLCKLDADVKGPGRSKRTLVELAVLAISG